MFLHITSAYLYIFFQTILTQLITIINNIQEINQDNDKLNHYNYYTLNSFNNLIINYFWKTFYFNGRHY